MSLIFNNPLRLLLQRLGFALILLGLGRIVFWMFNANQFDWPGIGMGLKVLFWGAYFDLITLFYFLSPYILIYLLPVSSFENNKVQKALKIYFVVILSVLLILSCIDAGYFPYSKSRLTITLFKMAGNEHINILRYVLDYIGFVPCLMALFYMSWKFYPSIKQWNIRKLKLQWALNLIFCVMLVLTIRGGFRLKPLRSIDTALFVPASHAQLAISSGFNLLESFFNESIEIPHYFGEQKLSEIMEDDYHTLIQKTGATQKNIVIFILESFGKEYTFPAEGQAQSYSPFLQELAKQSTLYQRAYSNGTRSVDAIPAILEGVPKLTKMDFMYSNYIHNITPGFPFYLAKKGYSCEFYHGGKNGTLGLEAFLKSHGWTYYGKDQYTGSSEDFDGQWGIFDGPYLQYTAKRLSQTKSPFVASVFTLSSHHPYTLPSHYADSFKNIKEPMHKTIRYTDNCLKAFFKTIMDMPWFKETIFIITGDHSGRNFTKYYQSCDGKYEVPLLVFDPSNPVSQINNDIIQHIDIVPLGLQKAGFTGKVFTISTYFNPSRVKMAFQNEDGNYQVIMDKSCLAFNGKDFVVQPTLDYKAKKNYDSLHYRLKGKIQNYYYRLVNNRLY